MNKLTQDEKERLSDLIGHDGFSPFLKELENLVFLQEAKVLKYVLSSGTAQDLAYEKARAEGARNLYVAIKHHLEKKDKQ